MKQQRNVIIAAAVILVIVVGIIYWSGSRNSRGKYKAPYKYYDGDRPRYH